MTQLELHKKIEEFIKVGTGSADVKVAQGLFINNDAKRFFFSQANETWLAWLWQNGFLNEINNKAEDTTRYSYRISGLDYLERMAEIDPAKVTEIILSKDTATKKEKFNPEVIERFLWIINKLPAEQISMLTAKMRDEKWVYSMRSFRKSGYEFEKIIKKMVEKKQGDAILELAQAIFIIKSKEEMLEKKSSFSMDNPFYLSDLDASGIFQALATIEESYSEKALQITTGVLEEIIKLSKPDEVKVFEYTDLFSLFDVDFFSLEINNRPSVSFREDIKNLAATIKKLVERTIGKKCDNPDEAKRLFEYINKLPSSRSMWRLRLFTLAQCPEVFKEEMKEAFFKLFEVENYYEIEGGTEYKKTLKIGFSCLSVADQRAYVAKVLQYFSDKIKDNPDQNWHKRTGWEILSSICGHLKDDEPQKCEQIFSSKCDEKYVPEPAIGKSRGGMVRHVSPVNLADFTIEQIAANLISKWSPEKLNEQFKDDDFLSPRGVEGLGDALKEDIKKRMNKYLINIRLFFDRYKIHSHYLYSLLRGLWEIPHDKQSLSLEQIDQALGLFEAIKIEGEKKPYEKKRNDGSWLADWIEVHRAITDILLFIVESEVTREGDYIARREKIINIIKYLLLDIIDSPSKDDEKPEYGEPFHVAINSVRGRAYQVFMAFVQKDGEKLASDSKEIFEKVLSDNSLAVRFVIGHYLAAFYFRDKEFITRLFPKIFSKDEPNKKDLYLASWEGYLTNTLYDKLFVALKDYYEYAITLKPEQYTERKYSKDLDEALAVHLALAFAHLGLKRGDDLFEQFWKEPNIKRHQEFISFVGRDCLSRNQTDDKWLKENVDKEKLIDLWNWALGHAEPKALSGFGFWINQDKEVLDDKFVAEKIAETLKKTGGDIERDYALMKRLPVFAEKNGDKTLDIILNYLLDSEQKKLNQNSQAPLSYRDEIKQALGVIYKNGNGEMKQKVTGLINTLIEKGSSMFWGLKSVLEENDINYRKVIKIQEPPKQGKPLVRE